MATGYFNIVTEAVTTMVTTYLPVFAAAGMKLFDTTATIRLIQEGFHLGFDRPHRLPETIVAVAVVFSCMVYYTAPIPGINRSLTGVITGIGTELAEQIDTGNVQNVGETMSNAMGEASASEWSFVLNPVAVGRYFTMEVVLSLMQAALLGVIALGFIVVGILVLIGPLFIPWALLPIASWLAWGWFRCFIQYSFYPVIANGFVFVFSQVWLNFFIPFTSKPMTMENQAAAWTVILMMGFAGIWGIFQVPTINAHLFSGGSGASTWRGLR